MTTTKSFMQSIKPIAKSSSWLLALTFLMACQSEISAQTLDDAKESALEDQVSIQTSDKLESSAQILDEAKESVLEDQVSVTPVSQKSETSAQTLDESKYTVLENPLSVSTGDKIEVTELFWYGCPHCFSLEPFVEKWQEGMPENAEFVKIPAIFSTSWAFGAKAFYTMEALGILDEANNAYFHHIHVLRKQISNLSALTDFLAPYNKSEEEVTSAFNSFAVDTKVRNATRITRSSTARGVPAILVDGKYHTSVTLAGGQAELFDVIDQLVEKAAAER